MFHVSNVGSNGRGQIQSRYGYGVTLTMFDEYKRHKVNQRGEEVIAAEVFFGKIIRQMKNNIYESYDGRVKT